MALVNQNQLIGSMVPDVYIKKITLESGGYEQKESNPHIQHPWENKSPTDTSSDALRVSIDLAIKDTLDDNMVTSWFGDQDFKKYLQLTVIQTTDPLVTKIFSSSNNAIRLANVKSYGQGLAFLSELIKSVSGLPEFASHNMIEEDAPIILERINKNTSYQKISLNEIIDGGESLQTQAYEGLGTSGGIVYDICHNVKFEISTSEPKHVSYFAATSIDLDQLADDFDVFIDNPYITDLVSGKVAAENVIDASVVNSKTTVFKNTDGEIWAGPVSQTPDGTWWTNTPAASLKEPLTKVIFNNAKIQDFRISNKIERLRLDFSNIENKLFAGSTGFKHLSNEKLLQNTEKSYFTDINLTIDSEHRAKFFFGLDYTQLVRDNSKYGNLYSSFNQKDLLKSVKVRRFILKRRRMANNRFMLNKLGTPVDMADLFDENEVPEVLISVTADKGKIKGSSNKGGISEIDIESELRHFEGTDKTMPYTTDGHYQYGVEIEVEDQSHNLIMEYITTIAKEKVFFDAYAKKALSPQNYDSIANRFTKKFIKEQEEEYGEEPFSSPWFRMIFKFALAYSFFKKGGLSTQVCSDLFNMCMPDTGNPRGIHLVQKIVDNFLHDVTRKVGTRLEQKSAAGGTSSALMPATPPLRTFKLEHYFTRTIDSNFPKKVGYDYLSNGSTSKEKSEGLKAIDFSDYTARVDSETLKYFDSTTANINIAGSDGNTYNPEDSIDNTKWTYLTPSNVNLGKLGGTCCLAQPFDVTKNADIQTSITSLNLAKKSPYGSLSLFAGKGVSTGADKANLKSITPTTFNIQKNLLGSMAQFNCTIVPALPTNMANPFSEILNTSIFQEQDPYADASDMMGFEWDNIDLLSGSNADIPKDAAEDIPEDPVLLFSFLFKPTMLFGTGMSGMQSQFRVTPAPTRTMTHKTDTFYSTNFYNINSSNNAIKSLVGNLYLQPPTKMSNSGQAAVSYTSAGTVPLVVQTQVLSLPNQVKSLFLSNLPQVKQNWHDSAFDAFKIPLNLSTVALNYKMIKQIEVLVGYETDSDGRPLPRKPIWELLNARTKELLKRKQSIAICRMANYENVAFGVKRPKGFELPTYDEYFILKLGKTQTSVHTEPHQAYEDKIHRELLITDAAAKDVPTEYLTSIPINSGRIKISKKTVAKVTRS